MKVILYFLYQLLPYYVIVLIRGLFQELTYDNCWRALARRKPILYDSEKKAKLSDVRSETCAVDYLIILPVEFNNSTIELHVATRRKKSLQLYCTVCFDFLSLMRFDMTCDVTLRDCSSFGKPGAGENTLRRLALFVYLDHLTKNDVTSGKKVR